MTPGRFSLWSTLPPSSQPSAPVGAETGRAGDKGWPPPWSSQFGKYNRSDSPGMREHLDHKYKQGDLKYIIMEIHQTGCDGGHCTVGGVKSFIKGPIFAVGWGRACPAR